MGRRLIWVLMIAAVLLGAGWWIHRKISRPIPPDANVVTNWPAPVVAPTEKRPNTPGGHAPAQPSGSDVTETREPGAGGAGFVLRQGETLDYEANITKLDATVARLKIMAVEKRVNGERGSWHLRATAHTENPYRMVFQLDDQFDSYSDAASMTSVQYEMHLNERGEKVDSVQRMLPSLKDVAPPGVNAARVLPGTRDPLGLLAYLRGVNWSKTSEVRCPVYDGHKLYHVRAALVGKSTAVSVPAGKFNTTKIEIHVMDNGTEMKDAHFLLYLANDAARLPVLLEAVLPVATARVALTKSQ
jgi:uncharacterized protein DUF3108